MRAIVMHYEDARPNETNQTALTAVVFYIDPGYVQIERVVAAHAIGATLVQIRDSLSAAIRARATALGIVVPANEILMPDYIRA